MRPRTIAVLAGVLLFALPAAAQKVAVKDLTPRYRDWLQEEVVYIISPKEKAVFLQLSNDREREMFIEAFWKARDSGPVDPAERGQGRALPAHQVRQRQLRPRPRCRRLALRPGPYLYHPGRAEADREVREPEQRLPDARLVLLRPARRPACRAPSTSSSSSPTTPATTSSTRP
ncbi:MAG: GWxTD domain-containing protein [Anaerotruncus sp.]|nr:GWxTD domain-containing protein [Anaerotruncus sp.]